MPSAARLPSGWAHRLPQRPSAGLTGLLCGGLALALYAATCQPGVDWGDGGIHQYRVRVGQLEHNRGLALSHPLHFWLGRFALWLPLPLGEPAHRLNLLSALGGAVGIGFVAAVLARLTRNRAAAAAGALAVLLSHAYWQLSVKTEVLSLSAGLMTIEWYLMLQYAQRRQPWLLVGVFAVNGLHVADHQYGLLTLVPYAILILVLVFRRKLPIRWLFAAALAWVVAASPYWVMVLEYYQRTGQLLAAVSSALFGGHAVGEGWTGEVLNTRITWSQIRLFVLSLGYCFPAFVLPLALVGLLRPVRRRERLFRRVLLAQTLIVAVFIARYSVVDLYTFMVPLCAMCGLWYGLGVDRLWHGTWGTTHRRWLIALLCLNALLPLATYLEFPRLAEKHGWMRSQMRPLPYRNEYSYFFQPWRVNDRSAAIFAREALDFVGPGGWLLADSTTAYTVTYTYLVHGGPGGIRIYSERTCLNVPGWPELTDEELQAFLRNGGRVIAVPSGKIDAIWGPRFAVDKGDGLFWQIRAIGVVQGDENRIDFNEPGGGGH